MFNAFIYTPLYNGLVAVLDVVPAGDVGVAVIVFTILVRLALFPLSRKATRTQYIMQTLQPELQVIKDTYKKDPQTQALKTLELYKKNNINPLSGIFLLIIQIPIIIALYLVIFRGGFPEIHTELLYSFIPEPETVRTLFLGFIDITMRSLPFALLAGITQYLQIRLSVPKAPPKRDGSFSSDFAHSMHLQMRYGMPVLITIMAWTLPAIIALYWITSNVFTIGQEIFVRKTHPTPVSKHQGGTASLSSGQ